MGDALHTHGGVTDAREARLAQAGLLALQGPGTLDARTGVLAGPGTLTLVTATATTAPMTVAVAPHQWVTSRGAANGPYLGVLEASVSVTIAAAPASGTRTDVVYVKQQDATPGVPTPDATTAPQYAAVTGAAGQGKPAVPVGAEELATVAVTAGATATNGAGVVITNTARQTAPRGARINVRNQAEQDALTRHAGLEVYRLDTKQIQVTDGTTWALVFEFAGMAYAFMRQATVQTNLTNAWTTINLDAEDFDSHGGHSTTTNTSRWTCPAGQAGIYAVEGGVIFAATGASALFFGARVAKNGVFIPAGQGTALYQAGPAGSGQGANTGRKLVTLAAGDYVEIQGLINANGWATAMTPDAASWMTVERIR